METQVVSVDDLGCPSEMKRAADSLGEALQAVPVDTAAAHVEQDAPTSAAGSIEPGSSAPAEPRDVAWMAYRNDLYNRRQVYSWTF